MLNRLFRKPRISTQDKQEEQSKQLVSEPAKERPETNVKTNNLCKIKYYRAIRFSAEALREAINVLDDIANKNNAEMFRLRLKVRIDEESWNYNSEEEFFSDYRREISYAYFNKSYSYGKYSIEIAAFENSMNVEVNALTRKQIESVFEVLEKHVTSCQLPEPPQQKPVVFIGHGRDKQWKDLKDHLHDLHGHEVEAYEIGARAGHAIRDILTDMMDRSTIAFLVMTGEDETADGTLRARQNVIHEAGLFQGHLGFSRAIVLLEEGVEEFSNINGIEQIRFSKNNIKETFGDVLATIKREFK